MTVDQTLALWNVIGTWVAGLSTLAAVVVALYLAGRSERIRLKVHVGLREIVEGDGTPSKEHLSFEVTNLSDRPITINAVGWAIGRGKRRRFAMQPTSGRFTSQYPKELTYGKQANFMVAFANTPNWPKDFVIGFVRDSSLKTLVAQVHTSVGTIIEVKPEKGLFNRLQEVGQDA
ncbi:MAG TPA: hypothetical protein VL181_11505 [Holophagaceae bacterium]|nr:hypothetical protein [Holophagaceae bacterium]